MTADTGQESGTDEAVRAEAIAWLGRLRAPDGAEHHGAFEDWYAADPRHADIYDDVLDSWERMALAGRTPIGDTSQPRAATSGASRWSRIAVAAAAALCWRCFQALPCIASACSEPSRHPPTEVASRTGEIRMVTLADGSRVTLDTDTLLQVACSTGERRLTLERGRARFEVAHDLARPFIVMAGSGTVIAHGTMLDVERRGACVLVSLLRGAVEVTSFPTSTNGPARKGRFLKPGQRLAIEGQATPDSPATLTANETRWISGMLTFDDTALGELRFSGTLTARDPLSLARMAAAMFDLSLSRDSQGNILVGRISAPGK